MKPSSVLDRPVAQPLADAERRGPGLLGQLVRGGILAALLALAVGAPGRGAPTANEPETPLTPARQLVELPFQPFVDPAPAAPTEPIEQPSAQVGNSQVAPRQVAPAEPAAESPRRAGGDTSVSYDNGSNDVSAGSGGSSVNNNADLHSYAGVETGEDQPEEDAGP